jgi:hypothetical protein
MGLSAAFVFAFAFAPGVVLVLLGVVAFSLRSDVLGLRRIRQRDVACIRNGQTTSWLIDLLKSTLMQKHGWLGSACAR